MYHRRMHPLQQTLCLQPHTLCAILSTCPPAPALSFPLLCFHVATLCTGSSVTWPLLRARPKPCIICHWQHSHHFPCISHGGASKANSATLRTAHRALTLLPQPRAALSLAICTPAVVIARNRSTQDVDQQFRPRSVADRSKGSWDRHKRVSSQGHEDHPIEGDPQGSCSLPAPSGAGHSRCSSAHTRSGRSGCRSRVPGSLPQGSTHTHPGLLQPRPGRCSNGLGPAGPKLHRLRPSCRQLPRPCSSCSRSRLGKAACLLPGGRRLFWDGVWLSQRSSCRGRRAGWPPGCCERPALHDGLASGQQLLGLPQPAHKLPGCTEAGITADGASQRQVPGQQATQLQRRCARRATQLRLQFQPDAEAPAPQAAAPPCHHRRALACLRHCLCGAAHAPLLMQRHQRLPAPRRHARPRVHGTGAVPQRSSGSRRTCHCAPRLHARIMLRHDRLG